MGSLEILEIMKAINNNKNVTNEQKVLCMSFVIPVSYTHLDVYKRQP